MKLSSFGRILFSVIAAMLISFALSEMVQINSALAAESSAGAPAARFATVERIRGEITAMAGENGPTRKLRENDPVFVGERIRAAASSEAILKTDDAGFVAVRPRADFVVEEFAAE